MGLGAIAIAQDGNTIQISPSDASDSQDSSSQQAQNGQTWADQADGEVPNVPDDVTADANPEADADTPADPNADADASGSNAPASPQVVAPTEGCGDVQDWDTLANCVSTQTGVVTITKTIDMPAGDAVAVAKGNVILTAATGDQPALTATATEGNLDAFFVVNNGATLTIGQSTDDAGFSYKNGNRWLAYVNTGGNLVVNNGTFDSIDTTTNPDVNRHRGTFAYNYGNITINGGTFSNNKASEGGVIYNNAGSVTVNAGEFNGNTAANGGVLFQTGKETASLSITGGKFTGNKSVDTGDNAGGGVLFQNWGATTITGGTFTGNVQTYSTQCTNADPVDKSACRHMRSGGGAIHTQGGSSLSITGDVTFSKNYAKAYGWGDGGGAIYAQGTLWIRNDSRGNKPKFDGNWAGIYDTQFVTDANGRDQIPNGGAGGAIFVQDSDNLPLDPNKKPINQPMTSQTTMYLMGGSFTNNSSGYLGGAIYTEVNSTTYVAKAVAYENTAGHFGGGLWLCPSGVGEASKGGNIALFDNDVDKSIDPNQENENAADVTGSDGAKADGTEAGSDFAIMNPFHKNHLDTSFMLMDTWFTDRTESAVTWYRDGIPVKNASGYDDRYQNPNHSNWGKPFPNPGTNEAITKSGGRYVPAGQNNVKIEDGDYEDHVKNLTLGWNDKADNKQEEFHDRGVALKAVVKGNDEEQASRKSAAKASAAVEISGNKARLSGGGFGTNGNVKFSSPYTASWSKVKNTVKTDGTVTTPTTADKTNQLAGSSWLIKTEPTTMDVKQDGSTVVERKTITGGPFDANFYPKVCTDDQLNAGDWENGRCWKEAKDANGNVTERSAIVKDNTANDKNGNTAYAGFDNNPNGGAFDINNLADGKYTMSEYQAPAGYATSPETYTFVVNGNQAQWQTSDDKDAGIEQIIGNTPLPGVTWNKVDGDHPTEAVKSTVWKVTPIDQDGKPTGDAYTVSDCVTVTNNAAGVACDSDQNENDLTKRVLADRNPDEGVFTLKNFSATGRYKLEESKTPDGYWTSNRMTDTSYYWFEIQSGKTGTVPLMYHDGTATDPAKQDVEVTDKTIVNQKPNVQWTKVDVNNVNGDALAGSEWTIRGPLTADRQEVRVGDKTLTVTAPVTDCKSESGADNPCSSDHNTVNPATGLISAYADLDNASGKFKVSGLIPAPANATYYVYELKETKAPAGYVVSNVTYTFEIGHEQLAGGAIVQVEAPKGASDALQVQGHDKGQNLVPNVKQVAALPFTGGWSARQWLLLGGVIAAVAGLVGALTHEYRKRKGSMAM